MQMRNNNVKIGNIQSVRLSEKLISVTDTSRAITFVKLGEDSVLFSDVSLYLQQIFTND